MAEVEDKEAAAAEREPELPIPDILPILPLKDVVVFPFIILPLSVSREKSITAVDAALAEQRIIMLVAQRDATNETPRPEDLFGVGTVAAIMRMLKLPDGRIRLLVQGLSRARVDSILAEEPYLKAKITRLDEPETAKLLPPEQEALLRSVKQNMEKSVSLGKNISQEVMVIAANLDDPARLSDLAASNLDLKLEDAQRILESTNAIDRLRLVNDSLAKEITVLTMQQEISSQARGEMDRSQREYFLRQQLRAIQQELGEGEEMSEEFSVFRTTITEKKIPPEAAAEIEKQIKRLERSHPDSAETSIIRTYLDWMTGLPWGNLSEDSRDIDRAHKILDADHYDIEKVKERILEYLAVHALKKTLKGPILCFVGPPGVGKTSLGRSIARALDRKFVRLSLGGVRDEAELFVPGPLSWRSLRPFENALHRDGQHPRPDSTRLPRPDGGHSPVRLHPRRKKSDRPPPPDPQADGGERSQRGESRVHRRRRGQDHRGLYARGRAAKSRAGDRLHLPKGRGFRCEGEVAALPHHGSLRREDARPGEAFRRRAPEKRPDRCRDRARLDLHGRRHALRRGARRSRQRKPAADGPAG